MRVGALPAVAALAAALSFAQDPVGSIEGVVIDSHTRAPVKKAAVFVNLGMPVSRQPMRVPNEHRITTDASGAFVARGLTPGRYSVFVQHLRYPARGGMFRKLVDVAAGQDPARVTLELEPPATISGRVLDEDGDPLSGCSAHLLTAKTAKPVPWVRGGEESNELGEYRVWGVPPGKYLVHVLCHRRPFEPWPLSPEPPVPSLAYAPQWYPMAGDARSAQAVEVAAGQEKTGIDFRPVQQRVYSVKGRVKTLPDEALSTNMLVLQLLPRNIHERPFGGGRSGRVVPGKGTFQINSVSPGAYTLVAGRSAGGVSRFGLNQPVDVVDRSVELELELQAPRDLNGMITVDGGEKLDFRQLQLNLQSAFQAGPAPENRIEDDGSFTLKNVLPGRWRVQVWGAVLFVKSVTFGGQELPGDTLDTSSGVAGELRILLSTKTATIKGIGRPLQQVRVLEVSGPETSHGAATDGTGQFTIPGLRPGKYRVSASADDGFDDSDEDGQEVTLREGETVTVELKAKP